MEGDTLKTKATHTASSRTRHLSLKEKNAIIAFSEDGHSIAQTARKFRISGTAVNYILKKKDTYKAGAESKQLKDRTRIDGGQYQLLEEILLQWIKHKRNLGIAITGPLIQEKALAIDKELWLRAKENGNLQPSTFKASRGWLDKFKKRNGIRQISFKGEKLSAVNEAATQFPQEFVQFINDEKYDPDNVHNADELGLIAKSLPAKTLAIGEEKEAPGFKLKKERVTVPNCKNLNDQEITAMVMGELSEDTECNDEMGPEFDDENSMEKAHENMIDTIRKTRDDFINFRKRFVTLALCTKKDINNFVEIQERLDTTLYNALFDKKN